MSCEYQALRVAFTYSRNLRSSILLFPQSFTSALSLFSVEPGYVGYEHQFQNMCSSPCELRTIVCASSMFLYGRERVTPARTRRRFSQRTKARECKQKRMSVRRWRVGSTRSTNTTFPRAKRNSIPALFTYYRNQALNLFIVAPTWATCVPRKKAIYSSP